MALALALLLPPGLFDSSQPGPPVPTGGRLLWEDASFIVLEDGSGFVSLE